MPQEPYTQDEEFLYVFGEPWQTPTHSSGYCVSFTGSPHGAGGIRGMLSCIKVCSHIGNAKCFIHEGNQQAQVESDDL